MNREQEITDVVNCCGILRGNLSFSSEASMPRPKPATPRKTRSIILPEDVWTAIEVEAERADRSVTAQIRVMIADWFKAHGDEPQPAKRKGRA